MTEAITTKTASPVCPHCGHVYTHDEMVDCEVDIYGIAQSEDTDVIECPVCDKEFWVKGGWTPKFSTAIAEELL